MQEHGRWHFSQATEDEQAFNKWGMISVIEKSYLQRCMGMESPGLLGEGLE